jgi:hypothetical protein
MLTGPDPRGDANGNVLRLHHGAGPAVGFARRAGAGVWANVTPIAPKNDAATKAEKARFDRTAISFQQVVFSQIILRAGDLTARRNRVRSKARFWIRKTFLGFRNGLLIIAANQRLHANDMEIVVENMLGILPRSTLWIRREHYRTRSHR